MNLRVFDSVADLSAAAAADLVGRIERDHLRVIGLSGGATPKSLYELLGSTEFRERLGKFELTWVVEDERYALPDHPDSNSRMIEQTLFQAGLPETHQFLRFRTELGDPRETAEKFEQDWHERKLETLDIAILGVGEDGHTASLFPATGVLDATDRIAREVWVPRLNGWRVTMTLPVLQKSRVKYVLVSGSAKREILRRVARGEDLPIARVTSGDEACWWFVDREAYPG